MIAVDSVKSMFTLADVLPSSLLQISQSEVGSRSLQEVLGMSIVNRSQVQESVLRINSQNDENMESIVDSNRTGEDNADATEQIDLSNPGADMKLKEPSVHSEKPQSRTTDAMGNPTNLLVSDKKSLILGDGVTGRKAGAGMGTALNQQEDASPGLGETRDKLLLFGNGLEMLKNSALDLDNSRNDVLPQRT